MRMFYELRYYTINELNVLLLILFIAQVVYVKTAKIPNKDVSKSDKLLADLVNDVVSSFNEEMGTRTGNKGPSPSKDAIPASASPFHDNFTRKDYVHLLKTERDRSLPTVKVLSELEILSKDEHKKHIKHRLRRFQKSLAATSNKVIKNGDSKARDDFSESDIEINEKLVFDEDNKALNNYSRDEISDSDSNSERNSNSESDRNSESDTDDLLSEDDMILHTTSTKIKIDDGNKKRVIPTASAVKYFQDRRIIENYDKSYNNNTASNLRRLMHSENNFFSKTSTTAINVFVNNIMSGSDEESQESDTDSDFRKLYQSEDDWFFKTTSSTTTILDYNSTFKESNKEAYYESDPENNFHKTLHNEEDFLFETSSTATTPCDDVKTEKPSDRLSKIGKQNNIESLFSDLHNSTSKKTPALSVSGYKGFALSEEISSEDISSTLTAKAIAKGDGVKINGQTTQQEIGKSSTKALKIIAKGDGVKIIANVSKQKPEYTSGKAESLIRYKSLKTNADDEEYVNSEEEQLKTMESNKQVWVNKNSSKNVNNKNKTRNNEYFMAAHHRKEKLKNQTRTSEYGSALKVGAKKKLKPNLKKTPESKIQKSDYYDYAFIDEDIKLNPLNRTTYIQHEGRKQPSKSRNGNNSSKLLKNTNLQERVMNSDSAESTRTKYSSPKNLKAEQTQFPVINPQKLAEKLFSIERLMPVKYLPQDLYTEFQKPSEAVIALEMNGREKKPPQIKDAKDHLSTKQKHLVPEAYTYDSIILVTTTVAGSAFAIGFVLGAIRAIRRIFVWRCSCDTATARCSCRPTKPASREHKKTFSEYYSRKKRSANKSKH